MTHSCWLFDCGSISTVPVLAGIPSAFVAIESVDLLCDLLASPAEQVRGSAAIALGYLSYNYEARRQLLIRYLPRLSKETK